ncbi:MAG: alpha/beta hydrolase [Paracoccaceae bacterium]
MSTKHLVDPDLLPLLDMLPNLDLSDESLTAIREGMATMEVPDFGAADGLPVTVESRMIDGPQGAGSLRVLIVKPQNAAANSPGIFHCHGGGYVLARPEGSLPALRNMVNELGVVAVSVDYRLSPETTFPGPDEDAYAALKWMSENAAELGVDADRIGIMGESAGGGMAAGVALMARDRKGPKIAFQNLLYPMLDDRTVTDPNPNPVIGEYVWTRPANYFGWKSYLGVEPGSDGVSPYAAPARAEDLSGLPPTSISTGSLDLFLDENFDYAQRLIRAGVAVEFFVYPGGFHGFNMSPTADVGLRSEKQRMDSLRRAVAASAK